jgi:outer membrane protein assembly factor BamB
LISLVLLSLLTACSSHKSAVKEPTPLASLADNGVVIDKRWTYRFPVTGHELSGFAHQPVFSVDTVYISDDKGWIQAISIAQGRLVWRFDSGGLALSSGLALAADNLVVGSSDGNVLALSAQSGQLRWQAQMSSEILTPPVIRNGIVIVRSIDGRLAAFDSSSGERLWSYQLPVPTLSLHGMSTPLVDDERVYVGFADGRLVALDLHDGQVEWQLAVAVAQGRSELERLIDVDANLVEKDGVIYAAAYRGRLVAVEMTSGRLLWARDLSVYRGLAVDDQAVYLVDEEDGVWAVSRRNGATLWKQEGLLHRSLTAPILLDGQLVVGDIEGYLHWLGVKDGSFAGRTRLGNKRITLLQQDAEAALYAVVTDGRLTRFLAQ